MKSLYIIWMILLSSISLVFSQFSKKVSNVGTTAAPFLEIGVGARAVAMGGAFVATANDVSALYWNPAGVARISRTEILFLHTKWIADVNFDYAGLILPLGRYGTLGGSITSLSMDDMDVRTVEQPEGTGERFGASDLALALTYAFNITDRFSIGINAKYVYQRIWKETARGFALDFGTLFNTGWKGLRIGASLSNFGTDMQMTGDDLLVFHDIDPTKLGNNEQVFAELKTDKWPLPLLFRFGLALEVYQTDYQRITLAADANHPNDNTESINLGFEYALREQFYLRAGYRHFLLEDSEEGLTLGAGFVARFLGNFQVVLDYAYADFGRLENAQRVSVGLRF